MSHYSLPQNITLLNDNLKNIFKKNQEKSLTAINQMYNCPNMDQIYNSDNERFLVQTNDGLTVCNISWEQGSFNNYRFVVEDSDDIIWPEDVLSIWIYDEKIFQELTDIQLQNNLFTKKGNGPKSVPNMDYLYNLDGCDSFLVQTEAGLFTCEIAWEQGSCNNYRFVKGDSIGYSEHQIIWPSDVLAVWRN